uniref:Cadherin domain-containing protein n=1 Tax=Oncorhynchus mykiss TaxID=8022 RepID=A0A8C7U5L8_ONCMY
GACRGLSKDYFSCATVLFVFSGMWGIALPITRYSIPEEMQEGSVVANLATDLGIDVRALVTRKAKLDIIHTKKYLDINKETGELFILEKIDREYICSSKTTSCFLKTDVILENPIRIFYIELEIMDINDNAPVFRRETMQLDISESTAPGERFSLTNAVDADVGANSIKTYYLSESKYFTIEIQTGSDGSKYVDLVINSNLDREEQAVHNLILTAADGGVPARSSTASIFLRVLDINDNAPFFNQPIYAINVTENSPIGTLVMKLNATDLDEGTNAEITYSYTLYTSEKTQEKFYLNSNTGEIKVKDVIDFEESHSFDIYIQARDQGSNSLSGDCKVMAFITDLNDNYPEVTITSFKSTVNEDVAIGTLIAVISISDRDSGDNGEVELTLNQQATLPFVLDKSSEDYFALLISEPLDRETIPRYDITFIVTDKGTPRLFDNETITLEILDVNDNAPVFPQSFYTIHVVENNIPGALLTSLSAFDPDLHENQYLVYFIMEKEIINTSMSMLFSINPENGNLYALKTFDFEREREFLFHIEATDSGVPPLSTNVTVNVFILDENDNSPVILPPYSDHGVNSENVPYSAEAGYFVAKIRAVDADSGYNALLSYHISEPKGTNLFRIGTSNGEIRTKRRMSDNDLKTHLLVILVSDNGEPSRSATVSIDVVVVESTGDTQTTFRQLPVKEESFSDLNLYLLVAIVSVSVIFILILISLIAVKCHRSDGSFSRYSSPMITTHPTGSWSYSKSTQQYDVCFSSDTPTPFPPADGELISINGGDTFQRTHFGFTTILFCHFYSS